MLRFLKMWYNGKEFSIFCVNTVAGCPIETLESTAVPAEGRELQVCSVLIADSIAVSLPVSTGIPLWSLWL